MGSGPPSDDAFTWSDRQRRSKLSAGSRLLGPGWHPQPQRAGCPIQPRHLHSHRTIEQAAALPANQIAWACGQGIAG